MSDNETDQSDTGCFLSVICEVWRGGALSIKWSQRMLGPGLMLVVSDYATLTDGVRDPQLSIL